MEQNFSKIDKTTKSESDSNLDTYDMSLSLVGLLKNNGIYNLNDLSQKKEEGILNLKGMSSLLMSQLKDVMRENGIDFQK